LEKIGVQWLRSVKELIKGKNSFKNLTIPKEGRAFWLYAR
jgi:hypothetical protein